MGPREGAEKPQLFECWPPCHPSVTQLCDLGQNFLDLCMLPSPVCEVEASNLGRCCRDATRRWGQEPSVQRRSGIQQALRWVFHRSSKGLTPDDFWAQGTIPAAPHLKSLPEGGCCVVGGRPGFPRGSVTNCWGTGILVLSGSQCSRLHNGMVTPPRPRNAGGFSEMVHLLLPCDLGTATHFLVAAAFSFVKPSDPKVCLPPAPLFQGHSCVTHRSAAAPGRRGCGRGRGPAEPHSWPSPRCSLAGLSLGVGQEGQTSWAPSGGRAGAGWADLLQPFLSPCSACF